MLMWFKFLPQETSEYFTVEKREIRVKLEGFGNISRTEKNLDHVKCLTLYVRTRNVMTMLHRSCIMYNEVVVSKSRVMALYTPNTHTQNLIYGL